MKRLALIFLLSLIPTLNIAQTFTMMEDANGRVIGTVSDFPSTGYDSLSHVLTKQGIVLGLEATTGAVYLNGLVHWESDDCSGEPFVWFGTSLFKEIMRIETSSKPDPLILLNDWPRVLSTRQSKSYKREGVCTPYPGAPFHDESTTDFTYIDPEDYGFEITPSGEWGFPPPLSLIFVQAGDPLPNEGGDDSALKNQLAVNGLFYDPNKPGHGFDFNQTEFGLMTYYYGHTRDGERLWLISDLFTDAVDYEVPVTLNMFEVVNGVFGDPNQSETKWGTVTFSLTDCDHGIAVLNGIDGSFSMDFVRLAGLAGMECNQTSSTVE